MTDIAIRTDGRAGRITLTRPRALNALTWDMVRAIDDALAGWASEDGIALVLIEAEDERAFCAGGDVTDLYRAALAGDLDHARRFWRDEYRMNARIAGYPKPVVAFLQGYTMGGGVGLGGHAAHRVVGESAKIAMPECGIGFVPDVGGSALLARAPGRLGEYLALTCARMGPGDAIFSGFADHYLPEGAWDSAKAALCATGEADALGVEALPAPDSPLAAQAEAIDRLFAGDGLAAIVAALRGADEALARDALPRIERNSPLSMATALRMIRHLRGTGAAIRDALEREYRVAHRILDAGDMIEGIRAAIIDRDGAPAWRHGLETVPEADVEALLQPLGAEALDLRED